MMLTVTLEEYPNVPAATIPFTVQYREYMPIDEVEEDKKNTTESGFEVLPFALDLKLDNVTVSGYKTVQYHLPTFENILGKVSPIYIKLPAVVKEFAYYDETSHVIHIQEDKLREEHEGTY